ncbi:DUF5710 domain-containing protein [Burkholderia multivorans]|uniref:DUF5710 domain-containing protein n=1 Tax=Burkholderia multivorans TaxID=87883 RepID=UPI001C265150|nr:DUF5710 domain-containing protein [Burkholderia multivorans]MBU9337098.1 DNA primase [Burkholderia multivorans]MCA8482255.1 DUF5710 domain-containing protein [Burkholderia multivorans]
MYSTTMAKRSTRGQARAVERFLASVPQGKSSRQQENIKSNASQAQRIYLAVPRADIPKARSLGAHLDYDRRLCWIDASTDRTPFAAWIVDETVLANAGIDPEEAIADFSLAMRTFGLIPDTVRADGAWHTAKVETPAGPRNSGSYKLERVGGEWRGYIRNFKGASGPWRFQKGRLTREQRAALAAADSDRRAARAAKVIEEQREIAARALKVLVTLPEVECDAHPYLARKGVGAHGLRIASGRGMDMITLLNLEHFKATSDEYLIIPGRDIQDRLRTVQALGPDGSKLFTKGARKTGAFHLIGARRVADLVSAPAVLLSEGYATGASIYEATGLPVIVCFDAGNLVAVAKDLVHVLPRRQPKLVCADNDQFFLETAVTRIAELGGVAPATECSFKVNAGPRDATRTVRVVDAIADGQWHASAHGKYRLAVECRRGVARSVTVDVITGSDGKHVRSTTSNRGVDSAAEAARILRCQAIVPVFNSLVGRPTDFNDLASAEGLAAVREQVRLMLPRELVSTNATER